jgi:cellulose synthase/poly-beta-1,6-N-acetylglucosamine synthase-like glycosyltransferase
MMLEVLFWALAAVVFHTYLGYPLLIGILARASKPKVRASEEFRGPVSVVVAAYNEEAQIEQRVDELLAAIRSTGLDGEVVVVSDGSTDRTAALASRRARHSRVRVIDLPTNIGKATALTTGCAAAVGDVIVFADARQHWAPDALQKLLRNFADPEIGAVSGELLLKSSTGVVAGVGLYWRFERWIRRTESLSGSCVGVTGAIAAVRRSLFRPIPLGTILDDVYWPMQVVLQGYRVVHDREALAFDQLPEASTDEFRRKVRTLCGNFQLVTRLPQAFLPGRNPAWFRFVSHKMLRLVVPWALLGLLVATAMLPMPLYRAALVAQIAFYLLGLVGIVRGSHAQSRIFSVPGSFLLLNVAAWTAFWVWLTRRSELAWRKSRYPEPAARVQHETLPQDSMEPNASAAPSHMSN